jgi:hypothetical protein
MVDLIIVKNCQLNKVLKELKALVDTILLQTKETEVKDK